MLYVLYVLAAVGALFIMGSLLRFIGFKRLTVEFHHHELNESAKTPLTDDSIASRSLKD